MCPAASAGPPTQVLLLSVMSWTSTLHGGCIWCCDVAMLHSYALCAAGTGVDVPCKQSSLCQAHNAAAASRIAFENSETMPQGHPWRNTLVQLGMAHHSASDKETVFLNNVRALGFTLNTRAQMTKVHLSGGPRDHAVLPVKYLATEILAHHPHLLFFGHGYKDLPTVEATLSTFWTRFRYVWPHHEVYRFHRARLSRCIPCRVHADEGISFRRAGIYQQ